MGPGKGMLFAEGQDSASGQLLPPARSGLWLEVGGHVRVYRSAALEGTKRVHLGGP